MVASNSANAVNDKLPHACACMKFDSDTFITYYIEISDIMTRTQCHAVHAIEWGYMLGGNMELLCRCSHAMPYCYYYHSNIRLVVRGDDIEGFLSII